MVKVVEGMLNPDPTQRKAALEVQGGAYLALREGCGIEEPHCVHAYGRSPLGRLTTKTPSPSRTPKQTTPIPSMYGGNSRIRSNSAVSRPQCQFLTPFLLAWGHTPFQSLLSPRPYLGDHIRHHPVRQLLPPLLASLMAFFNKLGCHGHSHGHGHGKSYDHGQQPRQRRTAAEPVVLNSYVLCHRPHPCPHSRWLRDLRPLLPLLVPLLLLLLRIIIISSSSSSRGKVILPLEA